jgi:hypothetical protein
VNYITVVIIRLWVLQWGKYTSLKGKLRKLSQKHSKNMSAFCYEKGRRVFKSVNSSYEGL